MRYREDWEGLEEADGWALLRQVIASKPVDWAEISDVLWWAERQDEEEGLGLMERFLDYLRHNLRSHAASGGGWYAGQRKTWVLGGAEFVMRWIPAGRFLMGAGKDDRDARDDEKPQRDVTITRGFWIGETPVTQGQYQAITGEDLSSRRNACLDAPVERMSWYDAAAFANRLSDMEGVSACFVGSDEGVEGVGSGESDYLVCKGWRLPTEAEWEYACRAGTTTPRYGALDDIAWHTRNSGNRNRPVRQKEANAWGLYDMLGNVWEWVYDVYGGYAGMGTRDPLRAYGGTMRVLRGGCSGEFARYVRSAIRDHYEPTHNAVSFGFRIVRSAPYIDLSRYQEDWEDALF